MLPGDEKVTRRRKWDDSEDLRLLELVRIHGADNWRGVSANMVGRDSKQCRERYINHLDPNVKKGRLSAEEWATLTRAHQDLGNKYAFVSLVLVSAVCWALRVLVARCHIYPCHA